MTFIATGEPTIIPGTTDRVVFWLNVNIGSLYWYSSKSYKWVIIGQDDKGIIKYRYGCISLIMGSK